MGIFVEVDLGSVGSLQLTKDKVESLLYLLTWEHVITQDLWSQPKTLLITSSRRGSVMAYGPGGGNAGMFGRILRKVRVLEWMHYAKAQNSLCFLKVARAHPHYKAIKLHC